MDDKTKAIVAHLTLIGWIIALVLNQNEKGPLTSFYLRQNLGLLLFWVFGWVIGFAQIPFLVWIWYVLIFILWVISLVNAIGGIQKTVPVVGDMFQEWFKGIS